MRHAYDNKRDISEPAIVEALEKAGAKVLRMDQPVDLLVSVGQLVFLVECKSGRAGLNKNQIEFAKDWPLEVIRTPQEAIEFVNSIRRFAA